MRLPLCFQSIQLSFDWEECKVRGQWGPGTSCSLLSHNSLKIVHSYLFTVVQSIHEHTKVFVLQAPCSSHGCTACRQAIFWQKAPYWSGNKTGDWEWEHIHRHMSGSNARFCAVYSLTWWTWIDGALRMWKIFSLKSLAQLLASHWRLRHTYRENVTCRLSKCSFNTVKSFLYRRKGNLRYWGNNCFTDIRWSSMTSQEVLEFVFVVDRKKWSENQ